jgi:hypothetical protein
MAATDIVTKRIHVGGLTPSITPAHIQDRFKSFGTVLDVEELKADALGESAVFECVPQLNFQVNLDHLLSLLFRLLELSWSSVSYSESEMTGS